MLTVFLESADANILYLFFLHRGSSGGKTISLVGSKVQRKLEVLIKNTFGITGHAYIPEHSLKINATSSISTGIV